MLVKAHHMKYRIYRWSLTFGLLLMASGCSFRQSYINGQENHLISNDHADVDSSQEGYRASVQDSGLDSERSMKARSDLNDARQKLTTDQRQYDDYRSASGQSQELRQ